MNNKSIVIVIALLLICVGTSAQANKSKTRTRKTQTTIRRSSARSASSTGQNKTAYLSCPDNRHPHAIDLGLPSGTKWACCNVGASKPEGYGGYFSWGETKTKSSYTKENYLNGNGTSYYIGKDIAGTQYDAATTNWGASWVMPNKEQMDELYYKCTSEWTTKNGIKGRRFTGPNGASIFLPAAGYRWLQSILERKGTNGYYWSSTLSDSYDHRAWGRTFYYSGDDYNYDERYIGESVRPVRKN